MSSALRRAVAPLVRRGTRLSSNVQEAEEHYLTRQYTYNDLPKPSGSWQEGYNYQKKKQTQVLAIGVVSFILSSYALFTSHYYTDALPIKIDKSKPLL